MASFASPAATSKIYSELGVGTSVKIYLPRLYGEAAATEQAKRLAAIHRGLRSEVILVVEDEERVRALSVEALRELGYSVVEASGPSQALRMLDEGQQVTLLFTDVVMPDMSGRQLADRARGNDRTSRCSTRPAIRATPSCTTECSIPAPTS